jgi:hypothetical protein
MTQQQSDDTTASLQFTERRDFNDLATGLIGTMVLGGKGITPSQHRR